MHKQNREDYKRILIMVVIAFVILSLLKYVLNLYERSRITITIPAKRTLTQSELEHIYDADTLNIILKPLSLHFKTFNHDKRNRRFFILNPDSTFTVFSVDSNYLLTRIDFRAVDREKKFSKSIKDIHLIYAISLANTESEIEKFQRYGRDALHIETGDIIRQIKPEEFVSKN